MKDSANTSLRRDGQQEGPKDSGAYAQFVAMDSSLLLRVPPAWSDLEGAGLGGIGRGTVGIALSGSQALELDGFPSRLAA